MTTSGCWPMASPTRPPQALLPPPHAAMQGHGAGGGRDSPRRQQTPKLQEEEGGSILGVTLARPYCQHAGGHNHSQPGASLGVPGDAGVSPS